MIQCCWATSYLQCTCSTTILESVECAVHREKYEAWGSWYVRLNVCVCVQLVVLQKSKEVLLMYDIFSSLCSYLNEKTSKRVHRVPEQVCDSRSASIHASTRKWTPLNTFNQPPSPTLTCTVPTSLRASTGQYRHARNVRCDSWCDGPSPPWLVQTPTACPQASPALQNPHSYEVRSDMTWHVWGGCLRVSMYGGASMIWYMIWYDLVQHLSTDGRPPSTSTGTFRTPAVILLAYTIRSWPSPTVHPLPRSVPVQFLPRESLLP